MVASIDHIKEHKRAMIEQHGRSSDIQGSLAVLTTLLPLAGLWWVAMRGASVSLWLTFAATPLIVLFTLRCFALMHECGHGSLFRSRKLNRRAGFIVGVIAGMPQYVWSQNHNYHHCHNGDWEKYRGPYTTLSVGEYAALSTRKQRLYRAKCNVLAAPLVGFIYLILNPRINWMKGSIAFLLHMVGATKAARDVPLRQRAASFRTRIWRNSKEYWHMFWNNIVLLGIWALMCWLCGPRLFFSVYLISLSLAGAMGIILFTVQHNFDGSYASDTAGWDYDAGAIKGTSYLILPGWLNWFTANIGYHHIHHLSTSIPGYRLPGCHAEYRHLFTEVTQLNLGLVLHSLSCILWDTQLQQIITVAEYQRRTSGAPEPVAA